MASADQKKSFLGKVPLFNGLKDRQLQRLADRMVERTFAAGDVIVEQGHGGEGFYIVTAGKAEATSPAVPIPAFLFAMNPANKPPYVLKSI